MLVLYYSSLIRYLQTEPAYNILALVTKFMKYIYVSFDRERGKHIV